MAFLGISCCGGGLQCLGTEGVPVEAALARALEAVPRGAPVVILVHGFRYHPRSARCDPFMQLYGGGSGHADWPKGLGFSRHDPGDGLCIGFGWEGVAAPGRHPWYNLPRFGRVYGRAGGTGRRLAAVINAIGALDPGRVVDVMAHSLGARVALRALPHLAGPNLGRVILMGAAEFEGEALRMLAANRANGQAEFVNVTARENDPFDLLFECFAPGARGGDCPLGVGRAQKGLNWLDIQIDHPLAAACLARRGIAVSADRRLANHWGFYLREGVFDLYRGLIRQREDMALAMLRFELSHVVEEPRWTRIVPGRGGSGSGLGVRP